MASNGGPDSGKTADSVTSIKLTSTITSSSTDASTRLSSYRLTSLDRLAHRQRLFEHNGTSASIGSAASAAAAVSATAAPSSGAPANYENTNPASTYGSKRDLFFKTAEAPAPPTATVSPPITAAASTGSAQSTPVTTPTVGGIASLRESLLASRETTITTSTNSSTAKVEALKRELADDNRERDRMAQRAAEKGTAPLPVPATKTREVDYVGFANLPNQVYRRAVKKGFEFTLMVVGESGLGKSTLINSMFLTDIYSPEYPGPSHRFKKTVEVEQCQVLLKENGVNLTLTIVDTPGFGDAVDNSNCWQPIVDFIESKYEEYLTAESRVQRQAVWDSRVHVCLYFIAPSGHGLKPLDVEFMKRLHDKVNIIPILAKADTMTPEECAHFKKQVLNEIAQHKIKIYEFPEPDDEESRKEQRGLKERVPLAVVGSNAVVEVDGKKLRGRKYPWGVVEVENLEHCDFIALRNMLIRTHMTDLKEVTNSVHYENYRCKKLAGVGVATNDGKANRISNKNPLAQMEEERREHEAKLKKMEQEMEQVFELKVKEKTQKLKDSENDLQRRHEQMIRQLEAQKVELEDKRKQFEDERIVWESSVGITLQELRRRSLESSSKEHVDGKDKGDKGKKKKGLF